MRVFRLTSNGPDLIGHTTLHSSISAGQIAQRSVSNPAICVVFMVRPIRDEETGAPLPAIILEPTDHAGHLPNFRFLA